MSTGNYTIGDVTKIISVARENAVLGQYEHALQKYKSALLLVQNRMKEVTDNFVKDKWKTIEGYLKVETSTLFEIIESCNTFKVINEESSGKKQMNLNQLGENEQAKQQQQQQPREKNKDNAQQDFLDDINYVKNISKQVESNINKIQGAGGNNNYRQYNQPIDDFNINKKDDDFNKGFQHQPKQKKQEMPSQDDFKKNIPRNKIDANANAKANPNPNPGPSNRPRMGGNAPRQNPMAQIHDALNSYQPGKKGAMGKDGKDGKDGKNANSNKSAFVLHSYPNGEGPDTELIEMLEREVVDTNPQVRFEDIAELDGAKKTLQEAVLLPLLIPDYFKGIRRPWRGVLLYGPPGTGKTMLAKALATQGKTTFFNVHSSSFASKWRGESEKLVRILFEMARFYAPTTIFIDEVDSLCSKRGESGEGEGSRRVKAELLVQMEGVNSNTSAGANEESAEDKRKIVTVMAATNRPWDLDDALRRRFEKRVYIPLPNDKGRAQLFQLNLNKVKVANDIDSNKLIKSTDGYSGADISNVCREAALMPMRRNLFANHGKSIEELVANPDFRQRCEAPIDMKDLLEAIGNISKSVSQKDLDVYDKWTAEFASV